MKLNRDTEETLVAFCAAQKDEFSRPSWLEAPFDSRTLAVAALYLSSVDWYGHEAGLVEVAERVLPGSAKQRLKLMADEHFDPGRFSRLLRHHLNHEQARA